MTRHAQMVADFDRGNFMGLEHGRLMVERTYDRADVGGMTPEDLRSLVRAMGSTRDSDFFRGFVAGFRAAVYPRLTKDGGHMPSSSYNETDLTKPDRGYTTITRVGGPDE